MKRKISYKFKFSCKLLHHVCFFSAFISGSVSDEKMRGGMSGNEWDSKEDKREGREVP